MPSELTYPSTRPGRDVPSSFAPLPVTQTTSIPRTSVVAFKIANFAVNTRESRSFGPFVGPTILKGWRVELNANVANAQAALGLGVAGSPITENSVALTTAKGWRDIFTTLNRDTSSPAGDAQGIMQADSPATTLAMGRELNIIIPDRNFHLVITAYAGGAGFRWHGDITLIDEVSQQALANFQ